ncbi:MAG: polysaccharide biosynthesis C-terminal domain-containing protein [Terracidiphilus sp.]
MRTHLSNAAYGMLDYGAYPLGMLAVAPVVLRNLGIAQYGVWMVATAAVSTGGILASGFGDANIQHVASRRGAGDRGALLRAVRSMMGINLVLGVVFAAIGWMLSPLAAAHVTAADAGLRQSCLWSLRIASVLMAVRAVESVCVSTQRAFERYGAAVRISILARLLALAAAAGLTFVSHNVSAMMAATGLLMVAGLWIQLVYLKQLLAAESLMPAFDRDAMRVLLGFGIFSWLQAVSGVVFGQVDRLMLGVSLGAAAVAPYALCAQMAQPVFGFAASGLHFLFPYLSHRNASSSAASLKSPVLIAFSCNAIFVAVTTASLLLFGSRILHAWAGAAIARGAAPVLAIIVWSSALMGLNVTPTYALLALGRVRVVTWVNLAGGAVMLLLMLFLTPRLGIRGIAIARFVYGLITLAMYYPLARTLFNVRNVPRQASGVYPVCEDA